MTNEEFSNTFDVLLASYLHDSSFGTLSSIADVTLDEYEKSIFLTEALDLIIKSYFEAALNPQGLGIDDSTRRLLDFSNLVTVKSFTITDTTKGEGYSDLGILIPFTEDSFKEGDKYVKPLFIINERIICKDATTSNERSYVIIPINYKEYDRMMSRAYSEPLKRQAWRLFEADSSTLTTNIEIIVRSDADTPSKYKIRYIRKPRPIVLVDLSSTANELTIDGILEETSCELNPVLHNEILHLAVQLALVSKGIESRDAKTAKEIINNNK